jgi:hypothetical protein
MSAFQAAIQSGDLNALKQLLASDVRVVTDGGGKVLTDSSTVARGAAIDVRLARGGLEATVAATKPHKT